MNTQRYREQTSGYWGREGEGARQVGGLSDINYYV